MNRYGVPEVLCKEWERFPDLTRRIAEKDDVIWRGQSNEAWALSSRFERSAESINILEHDHLIDWRTFSVPPGTEFVKIGKSHYREYTEKATQRFIEYVIGIPGLNTKERTNVDWWQVLARHHGFDTPLLDWTRSPYIAAFFAFSDYLESQRDSHGNVAIWVLYDWYTLGLNKLKLIEFRDDAFNRQRAQRGLFTRLDDDDCYSIEEYISRNHRHKGALGILLKITIPGTEAEKAMADLELMNITWATLFPDVDGAAKQAMREIPRFMKRDSVLNAHLPIPITRPYLQEILKDGVDSSGGQ